MNNKIILAAFVAISAVVCSCAKDGIDLFEGNYSFKTSGTVCALKTASPDTEATDSVMTVSFPDSVTVKIPTESGQMDITPTGNGNEMIISMNVTGGDIVILYAEADGDELVIRPSERNLVFSYPEGDEDADSIFSNARAEGNLVISGSGHRYDNIIIISFAYSGEFSLGETKYEIYDSKIDCRAKLNG